MRVSEINNVVVVGAGAMGSQIGMICALAGLDATVTDIAQAALGKAETELRQRLSRDVDKGRRSQQHVDDAFARLSFSTDLTTAASTADYVIEAATVGRFRLSLGHGHFPWKTGRRLARNASAPSVLSSVV